MGVAVQIHDHATVLNREITSFFGLVDKATKGGFEGHVVDFGEYNYRKRYAMTNLEQTIIREISTLPESRLTDVLKYVRFIKLGLADSDEIEKRFDKSWKRVRARAKKLTLKSVLCAKVDNALCHRYEHHRFRVSWRRAGRNYRLESINAIPADPTDNKFLEAAVEGKANLIVSGDGHLLELETFRNIPIITAREFITRLENQ